MKIAVIGGGGVRSMFLAKSLAQSSLELGINQVIFMDNDPKKLNIYGKMAQQVAKRLQPDLQLELTGDPVEAIKDADYIITTIRVGEDDMRIQDERVALNLGVLGQETTGAAGFSFAMRSVPALVKYCELAKKYASPDVKIFNFTNPAGVVSQTLRDMGYDFTYGICDAPSSLLHSFAKMYKVPQNSVTGDCYGLNHLSFFDSIKLDGKEILPELLKDERLYTDTDMRFFKKDLVEHMGCILNEYLYYFYYREEAVQHILDAGITRGEVIRDVNIHMTEELSHMDVENDFEKPLDIIQKNNDDMLIEALSPKESSVLIYSDKDFDDSIYDQITSIENDKCKLYGDYEEDIVIDISKQNIDASFSKKTDDLKKCYGEAVAFFYKDGDLVDVKKEELLFESSTISTSFKTEEEFDQAKVTHRFWTLEN